MPAATNADAIKVHTAHPADNHDRKPIAELIPYANNARTHTDEQVAQIAASMNEWGWTNPVLIDETGMIIAGHGRILAARKLGIEDAPVVVATGWSEAQKKAYGIADNQLALNAGWNPDLLSTELRDLEDLGFDIGKIGFSIGELTGIFQDFAPGSENDQGQLDELDPKMVQCPNCNQDFDLRDVQG